MEGMGRGLASSDSLGPTIVDEEERVPTRSLRTLVVVLASANVCLLALLLFRTGAGGSEADLSRQPLPLPPLAPPTHSVGVRGATTAARNTAEAIHEATAELVSAMLQRNSLRNRDVSQAIFTATPDLTAAFAATAARTRVGITAPLFGAVEAAVDGSPLRCIRVLLRAHSPHPQRTVSHVYLRGASKLRSEVPGGGAGAAVDGREAGKGAGAGDAGRSALDLVRRRGVLVVGTPGDYPPFAVKGLGGGKGEGWLDSTGANWGGSDIELVRALAVELRVGVEIVQTSWGSLVADMTERGLFDVAVGGITDTLERRLKVGVSAPIAHSGKTLVVRCAPYSSGINASNASIPANSSSSSRMGNASTSVQEAVRLAQMGDAMRLNFSALTIAVNPGGSETPSFRVRWRARMA